MHLYKFDLKERCSVIVMYCKTVVMLTPDRIAFRPSLRSRPKKERACERETREGSRVSPSRALVLSCVYYFQAPRLFAPALKAI